MGVTNTDERRGEIINCEKHGDFTVECLKISETRFITKDYCAKCIDEKDAISAEKERLEKEQWIKDADERIRVNTRLNAGISKRNLGKCFDDYLCDTTEQHSAKQKCMDYADNFPTDKSLLMLGSVGTGKTLLACSILEKLVDDHNCQIIKLIDLVRHIKSTWNNNSDEDEYRVINHYVGLDLLIIDEVGAQFGSDTEKLFIFDIIDGRYQDMKPTILVSNLDIGGVKEVIGDRCVDRLREGGGSMIAFDWSSKRK